MRLYGVEWPEGWEQPDRHVASVLGPYVLRRVGPDAQGGVVNGFRVRVPFIHEISDGVAKEGQWLAEYLTHRTTWHIGAFDDPLVACGVCLLYDTSKADAEVW